MQTELTPFVHPKSDIALLKEADHRIANHLALLAGMVQVQASSVARGPQLLTRNEVQQLLHETTGKIVSISRLHRVLAKHTATEDVDLADYLIENCSILISSLALSRRLGIVHRLDSSCRVKPEQAQALGLVVSEIIMNAVKHAHPTGIPVEIRLDCSRATSGQIVVEVSDDGVGLPEEFDSEHGGGVGFTLIRSLAHSLGATLTVQSDSLGTSFSFLLP